MLNDPTEFTLATNTVDPRPPRQPIDRAEFLDDILELLLRWHTHVINAESPAGYHAFLCTAAPRYLSMIPHLRRRHREIFSRIENLRRLLVMGHDGILISEYQAILQAIETHDELETEMLTDALENG